MFLETFCTLSVKYFYKRGVARVRC